MTPEKIARKIMESNACLHGEHPDDRCGCVESVIKEIEEAEMEVESKDFENMAQHCDASKKQAFKMGYKAAKQQAAKICLRYQKRLNSHRFLAHHLALKIRAMSPEGGWK